MLYLAIFLTLKSLFMTPVQRLTQAVKEAFPDFQAEGAFEQFMDAYKRLHTKLSAEQQSQLSAVYWKTIAEIGTPIVEEIDADNVKVHYVYPAKDLDTETNYLYIESDFHGFGTTLERQLMHKQGETDVMHRSDVMPKDAVSTYCYREVGKEYGHHPRVHFQPSEANPAAGGKSFFSEEALELLSKGASPPDGAFSKPTLSDPYAKNTASAIGFMPPWLSTVVANKDNDISPLGLTQINWASILGGQSDELSHLTHKQTFLCTNTEIHKYDVRDSDEYASRPMNQDEGYLRAVNVFEPADGKVEHVLVVNDGFGYMGTNLTARLDKMMQEGKIPPNTAVVFVSPLPGLCKKYGGSDSRYIEYCAQIEEYGAFLSSTLLPKLGYDDVNLENRHMIGSSFSGTAAIHLRERGDIYKGHTFAQAPSEGNREIIADSVRARMAQGKDGRKDMSATMHLSCGTYDSMEHAGNIRLDYVKELAKIYGEPEKPLPVPQGNFGHLMHSWSKELESTMQTAFAPLMLQERARREAEDAKHSSHPSVTPQYEKCRANQGVTDWKPASEGQQPSTKTRPK